MKSSVCMTLLLGSLDCWWWWMYCLSDATVMHCVYLCQLLSGHPPSAPFW